MTSPGLVDRLLASWGRRRWRGFLTLRRILRRPALEVMTTAGTIFRLHPEDYIDGVVLRDGYYEPEVLAAMQPFFTPGAVLWDIGANFGQHAVSAALGNPGLVVHAFEPNPAMHSRLENHARRNGVVVRVWPVALADRDGTATLHINATGNPGMSTLTPWSEGQYTRRLEVSLVRADNLIARGEAPMPSVIKLDVEGAEVSVLTGFGSRLHDPVLRAVVFEARADLLADPAQCPAARLLQAAGFVFHPLPRAAGSAHALGNFLARRDH